MSSESFALNWPLSSFSHTLIAWQRQHGRHDLPWQHSDPYLIWVSEIMLQQTQVSTVLNYYPNFIQAFPNVAALAHAETDEVTALWTGLGYYSRARNLHHAATQIINDFGGQLPQSREQLQTLKGVGRSTAAAIAAFAFGQREAILDGNVKRVLCRVFAQYGNPQDREFDQRLWALAESLLPEDATQMPAYTQGLMDLGATLCTRSKPKCPQCPMQALCLAKAQNLTAELPQRKPSTKVQALPVYWLCMFDQQGRIFLEKRPATGIWGQLYCPPMIEVEAWPLFLEAHDIDAEAVTYQDPFVHKLTHRTMTITCANYHPQDTHPSLGHGNFYRLQAALQLGLPKPLHKLLTQLLASSPSPH